MRDLASPPSLAAEPFWSSPPGMETMNICFKFMLQVATWANQERLVFPKPKFKKIGTQDNHSLKRQEVKDRQQEVKVSDLIERPFTRL